ncbi:MAG: pantoate--beta-alanine ligase [Planctomycetota bacterium]
MIVARTVGQLGVDGVGILVPTMGALHEGHLKLIDVAKGLGRGPVVVSVFVNPTQFNDPKDLERYPRTEESDIAACEARGANAVYLPSVEEVYPDSTDGDEAVPGGVGNGPGLEDAYRPGHFAGVRRVCRRLFQLVRTRTAVFGEKDWQQLQVIRQMVREEGIGVDIVGGETVRCADGLAMSSRNALLDGEDRKKAARIWEVMNEMRNAHHHAEVWAAECRSAIEEEARLRLDSMGFGVEYWCLRDAETLGEPAKGRETRMLVAAELGGVRLIDNARW